MPWIVKYLWLIPLLPLAAAGLSALFPARLRRSSAALSITCMAAAFLLSLLAFAHALGADGSMETPREALNFTWLAFGETTLRLGVLLDPLSAVMLFIVSSVSLLVFIFSVGYMDHDANFTRFFCFLSLFAGAMLMMVISNSLLLLFVAWELVGLSSYLLIGFWYHKPSAAAAMKKAFLVTRVGDVGFFIGLLWFQSRTGAWLFYDGGAGALEGAGLAAIGGGAAALGIALLIFCGAAGKSGQFPLHVWLPDAMEGPTPVSALIHAATMVAAGVFLVGRMYPVFELHPASLATVAFLGAFTAFFAASIALAQWDIKRILAYSTISQLGYMMLGLGVGGCSTGLFHLFTHAFFKALLFLGAGSILHACQHEQDIRRLGGLKDRMPVTFVCYLVGALALMGIPPFAGFFSKDEILTAAWHYPERLAHWSAWIPFALGMGAVFLTAFYMTRQLLYVFFGVARSDGARKAHESSAWMTGPLVILGLMSVVAGFLGFPGHNHFHHFLTPEASSEDVVWGILFSGVALAMLAAAAGWRIYHRAVNETEIRDPVQVAAPGLFAALERKLWVDEFFEFTLLRLQAMAARGADLFDRIVLQGLVVAGTSVAVRALSTFNHLVDEMAINRGFDAGCAAFRKGARLNRWIQGGSSQNYLRLTSAGIVLLLIFLLILHRGNAMP